MTMNTPIRITANRITFNRNKSIRCNRILSILIVAISIQVISSTNYLPNRAESRNDDRTNLINSLKRKSITKEEIQNIISHESLLTIHKDILSTRVEENEEELFVNEMDDAWKYAFQDRRKAHDFPFVVCTRDKNGQKSRVSLVQFLPKNKITAIWNKETSCFVITTTPQKAREMGDNIFMSFSVIPYTSSMKMEAGLLERVKERMDEDVLEFIVELSDVDVEELMEDVLDMVHSISGNDRRQLRGKRLTSVYSLLSNDHRSLQETSECDETLEYQVTSSGMTFSITPSKCTLFLLTALSIHPSTKSISLIPKFVTFNHIAKNILQGATNGPFLPFDSIGLNGRDQVVAVSDTGLDVNNCYFYDEEGEVRKDGVVDMERRKVVQYQPVLGDGEVGFMPGYLGDDVGGHGTHVCGTIAGHMSRNGVEQEAEFNGIAPNAKLAFLDISIGGDFLNPPSSSHNLFHPGSQAGAYVHVASWGANVGLNMYSSFSAEYDKYLFENQNMVFVVASGNFGLNGVSFPGTAKNGITVGASLNSYGMDRNKILGMSGGGIVEGKRNKPDIIAPGSFLGSAYSGLSCDDILYKEGTSMATPVIGGAIALIRQYFELYNYNIIIPSASLIKAILLNGAQPLYGAGTRPYDYRQNFGLVSLFHSLPVNERLDDSTTNNDINALFYNLIPIENDQVHEYNIIIPDNECKEPLSATLVWHDISTSPYILNDLDIYIQHNNTIYYPNGLNNKDEFNNVERIRIENPQGEYNIKVTGSNLVLDSILYSLVVTGCFSNSSFVQEDVYEVVESLFREDASIVEENSETEGNFVTSESKNVTLYRFP